MKIYTKQGDKGLSRLANGVQLPKDDSSFEALGDLDELNAFLGLVNQSGSTLLSNADFNLIRKIQGRLLQIGAEVSLSKSTFKNISSDISALEARIDELDKLLPALKNFILPGGNLASANFHYARTICRRAERSVVRHFSKLNKDSETVVYLNRLSDLLFMMARYYNSCGADDVIWYGDKGLDNGNHT